MSAEVLVVIGTGGMGEAIARRQGTGRTVLVADFNETALQQRVQEMQADGFEVTGHTVDVSSADSVHDLATAAAELGPVSQVVHTAGLSPAQAPVEAILKVDLLGVALVLDAFGAVIASGGSGIVIASMAGHGPLPLTPEQEKALATTPTTDLLELPFLQLDQITDPGYAYTVSKRANHLRVRAQSTAWGQRGARVNSISPGVISTAMGQHELNGENGEMMRAVIGMSGTGRIGTPTDIADAAAFLLGSTATFITGTDLLVDGGVTAATTTISM